MWTILFHGQISLPARYSLVLATNWRIFPGTGPYCLGLSGFLINELYDELSARSRNRMILYWLTYSTMVPHGFERRGSRDLDK